LHASQSVKTVAVYVMNADDVMNLPHTSDDILKAEPAESAAVEFELPIYPIQMTEERQKQERRVSQ